MFDKVALDFNPTNDITSDTNSGDMHSSGGLNAVLKNLKKIGSETIDPLTQSHVEMMSVQEKIKKAIFRMPSRVIKREMQSNRITFKESRKRKVVCVTVLHLSTNYETYVISASEDKQISIWELSTGDKVIELSGHKEKISTMTTFYSENHEPILITGSWDESVRVWPLMSIFYLSPAPTAQAIEKKCLDLYGHSNRVNQVMTIHRDGHEPLIASAASDGTIRLWSLQGVTVMILDDKRVETSPTCLDSYVKGENPLIIAGCKDNILRIWNLLEDKEDPRLIPGLMSKIKKICVFENAKGQPIVATVCRDVTIRLFDLASGTQTASLIGNTCSITSISMAQHKTGPVLVSGNIHGTIRLWNCNTYELIRIFYGHHDVCTDVALLPLPASDCIVVLSSSDDHSTRAWYYTEERSLSILKHENEVRVNTVTSMLQDGQVFVYTGTEDGEMCAWTPSPKDEFGTIAWKRTIHTDFIRHLVLYQPSLNLQDRSDDHKPTEKEQQISLEEPLLISLGRDSRICFTCPFQGEKKKAEINGKDTVITCLAVFSGYFPTSLEQLAGSEEILPFIITGGEDNVILLWSIERTEVVAKLEGHEFDVTALAIFESKEQREDMKSSSHAGMKRNTSRRVTLGILKEQVKNKKNNKPPVCVDDPWIVSGSMDSTVRVWSAKSRKCIHTYEKNESNVNAVAAKELSIGPIAVAGCEDSTIYVWQLGKDFHLIHTLIGHKDEIQSLVLHQMDTFDPILVSGSWDLTINVWSLKKRRIIKTFEGHEREITAVAVCITDGDAALLSSSSDSTVRMEYDFLGKCPKLDAIERAFRFDLLGLNKQIFQISNRWPRVTKFVDQMGPEQFFSYFHPLFGTALHEDRADFLVKFLPKTRKGLVASNQPNRKMRNRSLLGVALDNENKIATKVIMSCFTALLTSPNSKDYDDIFYDQNAQVSMTDLVLLANLYPTIFQDFITKLVLVPVKEKTIPINSLYLYHDRNKHLHIRRYKEKKRIIRRGNQVQDSEKVQPQSSRLRKSSKQMEECFLFIPLQNPVHMDMLRAMSDVCRELDNVEIFDSDYGQLALRFAWKSFGKKEHVKQMGLYLLYVILATFSVYSFDRMLDTNMWIVSFVVIGLQILLDMYFLKIEVQQVVSNSLEYLYDIWNFLDLIVIICGLGGNGLRIGYRYETLLSRIFLSIQSITMWFNVLFYLRAFENTGPLVSMILRIAHDMQSLIFVVLIVIVGFSQAFWLLSSGFGREELPFATVGSSFLNSFSFMLGGYDPLGFDGLPLERFAVFLSTFFMLLVSLLLLNLLIALMGDSYADVREKGLAQWRLEQVNLIIESSSNMDEADLSRSDQIYFRKLEDDVRSGADLIEQKYTMDERMDMLEDKLDKMMELMTSTAEKEK